MIVNILASILTRSANLLATAITVPLVLHTLGTRDYAVYATMASFSALFALSDLGIGLSVVNPVAAAHDAESIYRARLLVTQALGAQILIGVALSLGGPAILAAIDAASGHRSAYGGYFLAWVTMFVGVGVGIPGALGQRVLFGLGKNMEANLNLLAGRVAAVAVTYAVAAYQGGLSEFVGALQVVPSLISVALCVVLFGIIRPDLSPDPRLFQFRLAFHQLGTGLLFFVLNMSVFFELGADNIVLSAFSAPETVTEYDITGKPFLYICSLSGLIFFPIWPFLAERFGRGTPPSNSLVSILFAGAMAFIIVITGLAYLNIDIILETWVKAPPLSLPHVVDFMAVNAIFVSAGMFQSMLLNAKGMLREQVIVQAVFLAFLIPCKYLLCFKFGPLGLVLALTAAYIPRLAYVQLRLVVPAYRVVGE